MNLTDLQAAERLQLRPWEHAGDQRRRVVIFLQNQWFPEPERWRNRMLSAGRHRYLEASLFHSCKTGQVLRRCGFPCFKDDVLYENVSLEISGKPTHVCKPDIEHVLSTIEFHAPELVIALGAVAEEGVVEIHRSRATPCLFGPHPAARQAVDEKLQLIASAIDCVLKKTEPMR